MELRRPKKRPVAESAKDDAGSYYAAMARRTSLVKWLLIVAIPAFFVVMFALYHSSVTYDNLKFLLRDFSAESVAVNESFADVTFDDQSVVDAALFKGELAVVGSSNVTLFNSAGSKTFDYRSGMSDPVAVPTGKYLLAYDLGGTKYSIYTNLTRVLDAEADSVIENASMAQNGAFLLTERSRDAKYVVALYDADFRNRANYKKPHFVADAAISPSSERIVIVTVDNSGASLTAKMEMYRFAGKDPIATYDGEGFLPIRISFFEGGEFALICDTRIIFFGKDGNEVKTYYPENRRISCSDCGASTLCVAYSGNVTGLVTSLAVFDPAGNTVFEEKVDQKIFDLSHNDSYIFGLGTGGAYRFSRADRSVARADCGPDARIILASGDYAVVVSGNGAGSVFEGERAAENEK